MEEISIPTAGFHESRPNLIVQVRPSSCGNITNGVAMRFEHQLGGFVVSWWELKAAVEAIEEYRASKEKV